MLPEMRRRSAAEGMHPGGSELDLATSAAVQPGSLRCSAFIAKPLLLVGYEPEPNKKDRTERSHRSSNRPTSTTRSQVEVLALVCSL